MMSGELQNVFITILALAVLAISLTLIAVEFFTFVIVSGLAYFTLNRNNMFQQLSTVRRDCRFLSQMISVIYAAWKSKKADLTIVEVFKTFVQKQPQKDCFICEDEVWTFKEVDEFSDNIAMVFSVRLQPEDTVAIYMTNRIDYAPIWLGLAKVGIIASLINHNLTRKQLLHCIATSNSKAIIYSSDLESCISEIEDELDNDIKIYCADNNAPQKHIILKEAMETASNKSGAKKLCKTSYHDKIMYIYTSGTTGLPKPAVILNSRLFMFGLSFQLIGKISNDDVWYSPMPSYHASGVIGALAAFVIGGTTVVRKKFSASSYISDCIKYKVTVAQYIGEMCRYLTSSEKRPNEKNHSLKMIIGNGLRPNVWETLVDRFAIKSVIEFYGSTEGNIIAVNNTNKIGPCGFLPKVFPQGLTDKLFGALIEVDEETGIPVRGEDGLCKRSEAGKPGLMIGFITESSIKKFEGYLNKAETEKKYIFNVFKQGDKAFSSGDLLMADEFGWLYFHDRIGDTFRWKGENVSTSEVETILKTCPAVTECTVYGVQVPGNEGRVGMAALVVEKLFSLKEFAEFVEKELPKYAQPLFIRLSPSLDITGTYKITKTRMKNEGYDPKKTTDPIYMLEKNSYVPMTPEMCDELTSGARNL